MAHAEPRSTFLTVEALLGEDQADWPSNGNPIKVIGPEAELTAGETANENIKPRRQAIHDQIKGLKSDSTYSHEMYMTASGVNAADQGTAVATLESDILRSSFGGRTLGLRADIAAGTAAIPTVASDPGFANGDWVFGWDDSASSGRFVRIDDVGASPALTLLDPLLDVPTASDILYAAITIFSDELSQDSGSGNFTTLGWLLQGEGTTDVFELRGCKPTVSISGIAAGEVVKYGVEYMVSDWDDVMPVKQTIAGAPSGLGPITVGTGAKATILIADVGSPLAAVSCRGSADIELGVAWAKLMGPCGGSQGVKGYISELTPATVTLRIVFDDVAQVAKYTAGTKQHLLIQNGDQPTNATAIYFGNLEYSGRMQRVDEGGETITEITFLAHEDPGDTTGLTGDDLAQRRAPFVLLHTA